MFPRGEFASKLWRFVWKDMVITLRQFLSQKEKLSAVSCDGLYENPLVLGPCKLNVPVGTGPKSPLRITTPYGTLLSYANTGKNRVYVN